MSGKRHHIVPRFLQKGFASRIIKRKKKEIVFTWLYMKNAAQPDIDFSTKDTIVSENFYGKVGEINADDEITKVEKEKFSPLVDKMRNGTCNFDDSKTEIAELIAHFSIRTKVVREGFTDISQKMVGGMREITTNEQIIEDVFLNPPESVIKEQIEVILSDPKYKEVIEPALQFFEMLGLQKNQVSDLLSELTHSELENKETQKETKETLGSFFSTLFDESNPILRNSIKEGHNKSLVNTTIPLSRVEKYEQLNWNIYKTTSTLILGDVACIFREIGEKSFKPSCDINKTGQIYLPISSNQMIVGTIDREEIETDVKILNEAIASCSYEQFVCSENTQDKTNLIQIIGTNSQIASDQEIQIELDEIRKNVQIMKDEKAE